MTLHEALAEREALGTEKMRAYNAQFGVGPNQYGVKMGDIRNVAKPIKTDHALALQLWETGNVDARFLSLLVCKPKLFSADELERMVMSERFTHLADGLYSYVIKEHPEREVLRRRWEHTDE